MIRISALSLLLSCAASGQGDPAQVVRMQGQPSLGAPSPTTLAEPEAILRGRTTIIRVSGDDPETLKTLQVDPADGISLGAITPLPRRPDGRYAVAVPITVDAAATPGERAITAVLAPRVSGATPPGADSGTAAHMKEFMAGIIHRETKSYPLASVRINSHAIGVSQLAMVAEEAGARVQFTVTDAENDFQPMTTGPGSVQAEVRCGTVAAGFVVEPPFTIRTTDRGASVVTATLALPAEMSAPGCELRLRAEDQAGNVSGWATTPVRRQP